jgi:hypothetical protein
MHGEPPWTERKVYHKILRARESEPYGPSCEADGRPASLRLREMLFYLQRVDVIPLKPSQFAFKH